MTETHELRRDVRHVPPAEADDVRRRTRRRQATCSRGRKIRGRATARPTTTRRASPSHFSPRVHLVVDWDGTCTVRDSLVAAVHALGDPSVYEGRSRRSSAATGGACRRGARRSRVTEAEAAEWAVANVEMREGFHELVERYRPVIVSSGLPQLIRPVLEREGVELELRSNDAEVRARRLAGDLPRRGALPGVRRHVQAALAAGGTPARLRRRRLVGPLCVARLRPRLRPHRAGRVPRRAGLPFEPLRDTADVAAALS